MENKISGKLIAKLETKSGSGEKEWKTKDFIIETSEQYPKKVCLTAWNDKCLVIENASIGCDITASFNAESREFNGKWYTNLKVWKIELNSLSKPTPEATPIPSEIIEPDDSLPF